ncbi:MAG: hypothetical protein PF501_05060 [Salinisphaera sp.]|jgi:hypothetical protein|nr:hypothetical protein [Salinisphaera sp.]
MARKKKTAHSKKAKAPSLEETARTAAEHLERGRFKDAATDYKQLRKIEQRPEWTEGLARAYAGRTAQLAERGMIKEAIALWQNRAETCDKALADPCYLRWLIAADRTQEIARLYRQNATALAGADGVAHLQARLAAAALADGGELVEHMSADDPVARDFPAADAALAAYVEADDERLQSALARIAFRSPYRDFRQLLKALQRYETDPAAAAELTARVPADTPFIGILQVLETAGRIGSATPPEITKLAGLRQGAQDLLAALCGWSANQRQLLAPLARLGADPDHKTLFDFVIAHRKMLDKRYARAVAFMLAGDDDNLHRRLVKLYGALSESETARLLALTFEASGMLGDALSQWHRMIDSLAAEPAPDEHNKLRRALIHRHIADVIQPSTTSLPLEPPVVHQLTASLDLDAADRDSTLRLLDHYLHVGDLKAARGWADQALAQFPDDTACLFKAAETATAGKAYKKAARYTERMLAIDPINAGARGLLVDAYLGHARKQIQADKPNAARREIDHAADYARSTVDVARVAILNALTTFTDHGAKTPALAAAGQRIGDALVARFFLLLEAGRAGQNLTTVIRAAGLPAIKTLGERVHVLALVDALGALRPGQLHRPSVEAALDKLSPALNQAAKTKLDRGRAEQVCETLLRYHQYGPLKRYAVTALKRWPMEPLFVFYRIKGHKRGERILPWDEECTQLNIACMRAQGTGDERTAERIRATLEAILPPMPGLDYFDPFEDAMAPEPAPESIPVQIDGTINPEIREIFERFLSPADMRRLDEEMKRGESIPADISVKIQAFIDGDNQPPPPPSRSRSNNQRSGQDNSNQADLFGDDS